MKRAYLGRGLMIALCLSAVPLSVAAVTTAPVVTQNIHITNLKTKGAAEIDRRLTNLSAASAQLDTAQKLSADNKAALAKQIQDEVTGLTALKTKLAADTTLATARADVASIVTDYRVYVLMLPKTRLITAADRLTVAQDNLAVLQSQLASRVNAAKSNGKDVSALQAELSDMQTNISDATAQLTGLTDKLLAVQPSDYNTSHAALSTYRQAEAAALKAVQTARADAQKIADGLKALK